MARMLLSVKPIFVESIISGQKLYEYRKFRCKKDVKNWKELQMISEKKTKDNSGITRDFFCKYYKNKQKAFAYKLTNLIIYKNPLSLSDLGVTHAPQSYKYI